MKTFLDLQASQTALELAAEIYRLCKKLPREETYGISAQLKRAVGSIVANIAEGFGRYTYRDKANRYTIARGETTEVVAHLHVAASVQILKANDIRHALQLADRTGKLLSGLMKSSRQRACDPIPDIPIPNP